VSIILNIVFTRSSDQKYSALERENQDLTEKLLQNEKDNEAIDAKDFKLSVAEKMIQDLTASLEQTLKLKKEAETAKQDLQATIELLNNDSRTNPNSPILEKDKAIQKTIELEASLEKKQQEMSNLESSYLQEKNLLIKNSNEKILEAQKDLQKSKDELTKLSFKNFGQEFKEPLDKLDKYLFGHFDREYQEFYKNPSLTGMEKLNNLFSMLKTIFQDRFYPSEMTAQNLFCEHMEYLYLIGLFTDDYKYTLSVKYNLKFCPKSKVITNLEQGLKEVIDNIFLGNLYL
jgi:DNA repair exonuclease SbcCD ATPase subunit